jgi:hypothetical protein
MYEGAFVWWAMCGGAHSLSRTRAKKDIPRACELVKAFDAFVEERGYGGLQYAHVEEYHKKMILLLDPDVRTMSGECVIWVRPAIYNKSFDVMELEKLFFYSLNWLTLTHERFQRDGVALLADWTGFSISNFNPVVSKTILKVVQEVMPMRLKAIYVVNQPFMFSLVLSVVQVFMSHKLRQRLHILGDPAKLRAYIDDGAIPKSLGGSLPGSDTDEHFLRCRSVLVAGPDESSNPL